MAMIKKALEVYRKIINNGTNDVIVRFLKQNGEERTMRCTLNFDIIPVEKRPKEKVDIEKIMNEIRDNGILRVYDLEKEAWRTIPLYRTKELELSTKERYVVDVKSFS